MLHLTLAQDKSNRSYTAEGRLVVRDNVLSAAVVNSYYGREIPGSQELGLDPNREYRLYRHPDALAGAIESAERNPLMLEHIASTPDAPHQERVVGAISNVRFERGELLGDMTVWDGEAIMLIESDTMRDLSMGYLYRPVMEPGRVRGEAYDGCMMDISFNHVALVREGRVATAMVADSRPTSNEEEAMTHKIEAPEKPKAPLDAKDANEMHEHFTRAHKLISDGLEHLKKLHESYVNGMKAGGEDEEPSAEKLKKHEEAEMKAVKKAEDNESKSEKEVKGMDSAAITALVQAEVERERIRSANINQARTAVRPLVGDVIGLDSAQAIYAFALDSLGIDGKAMSEDTAKAAFEVALTLRTSSSSARPTIATDSKLGLELNVDHIHLF